MPNEVSGLSPFNSLSQSSLTGGQNNMTLDECKNKLLESVLEGGDKDFENLLSDIKREEPAMFERLATARFGSEEATLLHRAAEKGDSAKVDVILGFYPDLVNTTDKSGDAPLAYAAKEGNVSALNSLLGKNADVNAKSNNGWTALMWAAFSGAVNAIKTLLGYESASTVKINAVNSKGYTAYCVAVENGHEDAAKALKEAGADTNIRPDQSQNTDLMMAARGTKLTHGMAHFLMSGMGPEKQKDYLSHKNTLGQNILMWTLGNSDFRKENVQVLLDVGVDPNSKTTSSNETFLMTVSKNKHYHDIVPILLKADDIKLDERDNAGRTALMHLMSSIKDENDLPLVVQLIEKGANCELEDNNGDTVRRYADQKGLGTQVRKCIEWYQASLTE